jgi:hypothetical protein
VRGKASGLHCAQQILYQRSNLRELSQQRGGVTEPPVAGDHDASFQSCDRAQRGAQEFHELTGAGASRALGNATGDRSSGSLQVAAQLTAIAAGQSPARSVDFARQRDALPPGLEILMAVACSHRFAL